MVFLLFGTIARKKKSLDNLMDTILKVCEKEILPKPNLVKYPIYIENAIELISKKLEDFKVLPPKLLRWVSLKILDGEEKILKSIEEHFNISIIDNSTLQNIRKMSIERINLGREKLEENKNKTSNENKERLESWIEQQQVIKRHEVQYCDEIEYNYQICSHHTNITFYVNAFDPVQLEDSVEEQYKQHRHYFYKVVFTPMYQCTLTSDMIQTVVQEMTQNMNQYMLFDLEEDFYQFINQTISYLPKEKVLKLG